MLGLGPAIKHFIKEVKASYKFPVIPLVFTGTYSPGKCSSTLGAFTSICMTKRFCLEKDFSVANWACGFNFNIYSPLKSGISFYVFGHANKVKKIFSKSQVQIEKQRKWTKS